MMMKQGGSKTTTDVEEIKTWAQERNGRPSVVVRGGEKTGLLRFDFGEKEGNLEEISWEDFAKLFEENRLAFLYQEKTKDGKQSRFFKFVSR